MNAPSRIPLLVAQLPDTEALTPYLRQIDANRWYTNFGPLVTQLEQRFAASFAPTPVAPVAISASNGTAGLELALCALELMPGARVLLPALTFVATATSVIRSGYRPIIGDVDPDTWLLTPEIARAYAALHRIDAVMPVATFGNPQDVDAWDRFVEDTGIPVIIDAAGAFGNQRAGRRCHVVFSLHATKALAAGEGGMVVSYDTALANTMPPWRMPHWINGLSWPNAGAQYKRSINACCKGTARYWACSSATSMAFIRSWWACCQPACARATCSRTCWRKVSKHASGTAPRWIAIQPSPASRSGHCPSRTNWPSA